MKADERFFQRAMSTALPKPPLWLMRQAGRYLPEYRETRARAGDFLSLCYNPELACEVTLQPIRRFGFDASIIFSDILLIPQALGQKLWFEEGEGPRLGAPDWTEFDIESLNPVYEAIGLTRANLPKETALIGFAGAPWTLLLYALQGKGGEEFVHAKKAIRQDKQDALFRIEMLTQAIIWHLHEQVKAGCDTVQIFDSWAAFCPPQWRRDFIINPIKTIVGAMRLLHPGVKVIVFAKGFADLKALQKHVQADVIGIDQFTDLKPMKNCVQGNLDPMILKTGGDGLDRAIDDILARMDGQKHIFNLGHGIDKDTPIAHVERLVQKVRG